jgi:hypothetical protein
LQKSNVAMRAPRNENGDFLTDLRQISQRVDAAQLAMEGMR